MSTVWAASRDASVWDRPNTRSRKQVHIAVNVVEVGGGEEHGEAACAPGRMPLDMSVTLPAQAIPDERRCRRRGCATRWPTLPAGPNGRD